MIVPELDGGLGNQMFQIAAAYGHARKVNDGFAVNYNHKQPTPSQGHLFTRYKDTVYKTVPHTNNVPHEIYQEPRFKYQPIPEKKNLRLRGYFQCEKHFEHVSNEVKSLFSIPRFDRDSFYNSGSSVRKEIIITAHIRRGDYIKKKQFHNVLGIEYYQKALEVLDAKHYKLIIVTDAPEQVRKEFSSLNNMIYQGSNEVEDFSVLMSGHYIIGANSSFSWWASYLGTPEKCVFPSQWFGPLGPKHTEGLYRNDMIVV